MSKKKRLPDDIEECLKRFLNDTNLPKEELEESLCDYVRQCMDWSYKTADLNCRLENKLPLKTWKK